MPTTIVSDNAHKLLQRKQLDLTAKMRIQDLLDYLIINYIDLVTDDKVYEYQRENKL